MRRQVYIICFFAVFWLPLNLKAEETLVLYDQDFERPSAYKNSFYDFYKSRDGVNENYGDQPEGFRFAQKFTVEVLNVTGSRRGDGTAALGTGWKDPSGKGGDFAIGMLSDDQDDRLGLSFNLSGRRFLNLSMDLSSIDVSRRGGFAVPGQAPVIRLTLHDNPGGRRGTKGSKILDRQEITGKSSARDTFDWTTHVVALDASNVTDGSVILEIDLRQGGYAAFDNLLVAASDAAEDLGGMRESEEHLLGGLYDQEGRVVADTVIGFESSGAGPIRGPYGWLKNRIAVAVDAAVVTDAQGDSGLSLPEGSSVIVCFSDHMVVDGPGDDLLIVAPQGPNEKTAVYVADGISSSFLYLGEVVQTMDGAPQARFLGIDLARSPDLSGVGVVKLVGQDLGGESPGFDVDYVAAPVESVRRRRPEDEKCSAASEALQTQPVK